MTPIAPTDMHEGWLRRVSDYHSGGIGAAERAQVEAHLATCAECREALAMYQRFYALARSPLALGVPSADLASRRTLPARGLLLRWPTQSASAPGADLDTQRQGGTAHGQESRQGWWRRCWLHASAVPASRPLPRQAPQSRHRLPQRLRPQKALRRPRRPYHLSAPTQRDRRACTRLSTMMVKSIASLAAGTLCA